MHTDSLIVEKVHKHFTDRRIPALSVHDGFIIDYTHVEELKAVMSEASAEVVGVGLATSNTYFGLDEPSRGRPDAVTLDYIRWRQTARCQGYLDRLRDHEERTGQPVVPYRV